MLNGTPVGAITRTLDGYDVVPHTTHGDEITLRPTLEMAWWCIAEACELLGIPRDQIPRPTTAKPNIPLPTELPR
jgi:hypothetical protein